MKCYKVTFGDKHQSSGVSGYAQVEYVEGKATEAPPWLAEMGYHLCAFATLEDAQDSTAGCENVFTIWEAEGEDEVYPLPQFLSPACLTNGVPFPVFYGYWPRRTLMFKRITILSKVEGL